VRQLPDYPIVIGLAAKVRLVIARPFNRIVAPSTNYHILESLQLNINRMAGESPMNGVRLILCGHSVQQKALGRPNYSG
jgi:hypothetical protein